MTNNAPISVIIPAHNAERFIAETIQSIHAQTLPVAEVVVVDDGSSDRTVEIAQALNVRVIRQSNQGLSAARNAGILTATQPWIALVDADDVWEQNKIQHQWNAICLCPDVGIVSCDYYQIDSGGDLNHQPPVDPNLRRRYFDTYGLSINACSRVFKRVMGDLPDFFFPIPSTVLIRREAILASGLFDERLRRCEDVECFMRLLADNSLLVVEQELVGYRRHDRSLSNDRALMRQAIQDVLGVMDLRGKKYINGARDLVYKWWRQSEIEFGRALTEGGQRAEARTIFIQALREKFALRTALLLVFTYGSPKVFKYFLRIKRALVRKNVITQDIKICFLQRPNFNRQQVGLVQHADVFQR